MPNEVLVKTGTPVVWADTTDYGGAPYTRTHQIDISGLADGAARQGAKADLGATRAQQYAVRVGIELDVDLSAAGSIYVYWSSSPSGTAGTGNSGGASGSDAAYTDGVNSHKENLEFIGTLYLPATADDDILYDQVISVFSPKERYGMPVVFNESGQALEATANLMYVALIPMIDEIQ